MNNKYLIGLIISTCALALPLQSQSGWLDWLNLDSGKETSSSPQDSSQTGAAALTNSEVINGLKEALQKATGVAVNSLGSTNGFLDNPKVRIPMPGNLQKVESTLRSLGASRYADEFVETMNHAAEKSVVKAAPLFTSAIRQMTIEDGMNILRGGDDAATQFFRRKTEADLNQQMLPITREMTSRSGVTASYKNMIDKLGFAKSLIGEQNVDLDQYVTTKAIDGLFVIVAEQEKLIRKDPVAQTTQLLKKVFGSR